MLIPAVAKKDEVIQKFAEILYTDDYFWYCGYGHGHYIPELKDSDDHYQWVSVNGDKVCGYIAYRINPSTDRVSNFGMISFDHSDLTFARDVIKLTEELVNSHRCIEFRMISGNPVQKYYDRFIEEHGGHKFMLHGICRDNHDVLRDEWIYEICRKGSENE